jgi:hypothetical protein
MDSIVLLPCISPPWRQGIARLLDLGDSKSLELDFVPDWRPDEQAPELDPVVICRAAGEINGLRRPRPQQAVLLAFHLSPLLA